MVLKMQTKVCKKFFKNYFETATRALSILWKRFKTDPIKQKRHKKLNNDFLAESKYLLLLHT